MTTLNKIVFDALNIVYGGLIPDDSDISQKLVEYHIEQYRALLIKQELSTRGKVPENYLQHFCVTMEKVDKSACCGIVTNCEVMRSTTKLPKFINSNGKAFVQSVSSVDGSTHFSRTSFYEIKFNSSNRFTGTKQKYYLKDDYLYVVNKDILEKVAVSGIIENPSELSTFYNCSGTQCFTSDSEYPISADMANLIVDMVIKNRLAIMRGMPKDLKNDNIDKAAAQAEK